jgi:hypothetical protein
MLKVSSALDVVRVFTTFYSTSDDPQRAALLPGSIPLLLCSTALPGALEAFVAGGGDRASHGAVLAWLAAGGNL